MAVVHLLTLHKPGFFAQFLRQKPLFAKAGAPAVPVIPWVDFHKNQVNHSRIVEHLFYRQVTFAQQGYIRIQFLHLPGHFKGCCRYIFDTSVGRGHVHVLGAVYPLIVCGHQVFTQALVCFCQVPFIQGMGLGKGVGAVEIINLLGVVGHKRNAKSFVSDVAVQLDVFAFNFTAVYGGNGGVKTECIGRQFRILQGVKGSFQVPAHLLPIGRQ